MTSRDLLLCLFVRGYLEPVNCQLILVEKLLSSAVMCPMASTTSRALVGHLLQPVGFVLVISVFAVTGDSFPVYCDMAHGGELHEIPGIPCSANLSLFTLSSGISS